MTDMTTSSPSTLLTVEQLAVPRGMIAATEPYRLAARLLNAIPKKPGKDLLELVRVDPTGRLLCLQDDEMAVRWFSGDQARRELERLPVLEDVVAAHHAIRRDLETEPPIEHRVDLVCMMLDVQQLKPTDAYIQVLAWKLGDCPEQRGTEVHRRAKKWFSMVTITRAIEDVLMTIRPEYGRPVPISDVLDVAGRHASRMIWLDRSIVNLRNIIRRLNQIVEATKDARPPDDDELIPF